MSLVNYIVGVGCDAQPIYVTHDTELDSNETEDTNEVKE